MRHFLGSCCVAKISDDPGEIQVAPHSKPLLRCLLGLGLHSVNYSYCSFSCPHHLRCFGTCCADDVCFGREQFTNDVSEPRYFFVSALTGRRACYNSATIILRWDLAGSTMALALRVLDLSTVLQIKLLTFINIDVLGVIGP